MNKNLLKEKFLGFTLIELLVVIAIIGLLSSSVIISTNTARKKARDARRLADLKQIANAMEIYLDSNNRKFPDSLDALAPNYIATLPTDPLTKANYPYCSNGTAEGTNDGTTFHLGAAMEEYNPKFFDGDADLEIDGCESLAGSPSFNGYSDACADTQKCNGENCDGCLDFSNIVGVPADDGTGGDTGGDTGGNNGGGGNEEIIAEGCEENTGRNWLGNNDSRSWSQFVSLSKDGNVAMVNSADNAWPSLTEGKILISHDGGSTWEDKTVTKKANIHKMSADGKYITILQNRLRNAFFSSNSGNTWEERAITNKDLNWYALAISADGKYQTAGASDSTDTLYVSEDSGMTWQSRGPAMRWWSEITMSSDGKHQIASAPNDRSFYVSDDYGKTWTSGGVNAPITEIAISADGKYQAAAGFSSWGDRLYTSSNYGKTWYRKNLSYWRDIAISDDGKNQVAVTFSGMDSWTGRIFVSNDYGETWTEKVSAYAIFFDEVAISASGQIQTITTKQGYNGPLYTSNDFGNTWTTTGPTGDWYGVAMSADGKKQIATMSNGQVYVSGCK